MSFVVKQLQLLWSEKMIRLMFADLLSYVEIDAEKANKNPSPSRSRSPKHNKNAYWFSYPFLT